MATNLTMPRLSDTMTTGKVLSWKKKVGDAVAPGDVLAEIESDKATMEFEAFEEGVLLDIKVPEGESAAIGAVLAVLGEAGEKVAATPDAAPVAEKETKKAPEKTKPEPKKTVSPTPAPAAVVTPATPIAKPPVPTPAPQPIASAPSHQTNGGRIIASPVAMRLAAELGVDLRNVTGTGPDGRITRSDVEAAASGKAPTTPRPAVAAAPTATPIKVAESPIRSAAPAPAPHSGTEPLSQMRSAIARRMTEGWQAPMFTVTVEVKMDRIVDLRKQWKELEHDAAPSINDFIVAACAKALRQFPRVNASFHGDSVVFHEQQDIGIAVALDDGLITPVIRDAANKSLRQIAGEAKILSHKARDRKLQPEEFTGSTFTVSNLGMFDVAHFTAIVNPPEAAILAVGSVREMPVVDNGELAIENRMMMTISGDHRVIDGATGAQFLGVVRQLLENPLSLL